MGSFSITLGFFLVLAFWLPGHIGANPVYSAVSNTDLMDFKVGPGSGTQTGTRVSLVLGPFLRRPLSLYLFCLYKEPARPPLRDGSALGRSPWDPSDRSALLKSKLRALLAGPRSLRRSSCFGGRIDRIGAQSGLGCNSFRVRGAVPCLPV